MPRQTFEEVVLPHLDAAFNYARWLAKSDADAEDIVQDAYVRALRFFSSLRSNGCSSMAAHDCAEHLVWTVSADERWQSDRGV